MQVFFWDKEYVSCLDDSVKLNNPHESILQSKNQWPIISWAFRSSRFSLTVLSYLLLFMCMYWLGKECTHVPWLREGGKQTARATASSHWGRLAGLNSDLQIGCSTRAASSSQPLIGLFLFSFNQSECFKSLSSLTYILSKVEHIIYSTKKTAKMSFTFSYQIERSQFQLRTQIFWGFKKT